MADGLNKVQLIGNLGADPEHRQTQTGKDVVNMRIATSESWKDDTGQKQTATEWHRITVWGRSAVACRDYLKTGSQVYVEGKIRTQKYEKDGIEKYSTEIIASKVLFLGSKNSEGGNYNSTGGQSQTGYNNNQSNNQVPIDDDIPF